MLHFFRSVLHAFVFSFGFLIFPLCGVFADPVFEGVRLAPRGVEIASSASLSAQAAAQEAGGVVTFGQASDMAEYGPFPRVSSIIDNWAPYYIARTQAVIDGTWESVDTWDGIPTGMVEIGEITDSVPAEVKAEAEAMIEAIRTGAYHPFTGPINKQDGSVWLAEGEVADDGTLLGMNFYVEGLDGEIPQ